MTKTLDLRHHRHTGKRMSHEHTSYRSLFVILAVLGIAMFFMSPASADDYQVTATVPAPIPTVSATVTQPAPGTMLTTPNVTISGTCEILGTPAIISVWSGTQMLGSTSCSPSGMFSIPITLAIGSNELVIKQETITGDFGPDSILVTFFYSIPPTDVPEPANPIVTNLEPVSRDLGDPLSLEFTESFVNFRPKKALTFSLKLSGGTAPYSLNIEWGDGKVQELKDLSAGPLSLTHTYTEAKAFTILFRLTDQTGVSLRSSLAARTMVRNTTIRPAEVVASTVFGASGLSRVVWNVYFMATFGVVLLWASGFTAQAGGIKAWLAQIFLHR